MERGFKEDCGSRRIACYLVHRTMMSMILLTGDYKQNMSTEIAKRPGSTANSRTKEDILVVEITGANPRKSYQYMAVQYRIFIIDYASFHFVTVLVHELQFPDAICCHRGLQKGAIGPGIVSHCFRWSIAGCHEHGAVVFSIAGTGHQ